jgi:hypothetical protein
MAKKPFSARKTRELSTSGLDRLGGKKLSQHGVEFSHKVKEVRKHATGGRYHNNPHHAG